MKRRITGDAIKPQQFIGHRIVAEIAEIEEIESKMFTRKDGTPSVNLIARGKITVHPIDPADGRPIEASALWIPRELSEFAKPGTRIDFVTLEDGTRSNGKKRYAYEVEE